MLDHMLRAHRLGRMTDEDFTRLLDVWRRCYVYHPYPNRAPEGFLAERYREARATHDRKRLAIIIHACQGAHLAYDPGRE